jgi:hypothetical protein
MERMKALIIVVVLMAATLLATALALAHYRGA